MNGLSSRLLWRAGCAGLLALSALVIGCDKDEKQEPSPPVSPPAPPPVEKPAPPAPWYERTWRGEARLSEGPGWGEVDGGQRNAEPSEGPEAGSEPKGGTSGNKADRLRVEVVVDPDRQVSGRALFQESELDVVGVLDEESLRLRLRAPRVYGTLVMAVGEDKQSFGGEVRLSTVESVEERALWQAYSGRLSLSANK